MAATSKLVLFNDVLREIGSHPLANLTTANTRLQELNGAFDHAVEYMLSRVDWNFARRRANLTGTSDISVQPFIYRYAQPSDYLRKVWVKTAADDDFQLPHAEIAAAIYGFETAAKIEYISDHADNYDPANWPPQFTRCMVIYLALLVGPKLARAGDDDAKSFYQKLDIALADAAQIEAVYVISASIPVNRTPVMRRAIELLGQQIAGAAPINGHLDRMRRAMNKSWDHTVKYVLEQGAWNFASKRAAFSDGATGDTNIPSESVYGIIEGYSVEPASSSSEAAPNVSGFDFSYPLPVDFLHKIWIKTDVASDFECAHQRLGAYIFTNSDPCVMEYVARDDYTTDPDNWPATFLDAVAACLALSVAPEFVIEQNGKAGRVTASQVRDRLEAVYLRKLSDAKMKDAAQQEPKTIPMGRFARARIGGTTTGSLRRLN